MDGRSIVSRKPREFRRGFHERDDDSTAFPRRESREAIFVGRARERVWGRVAVAAALRMSRFRKLVVTPDAERAKRLVFDLVSRPSLEVFPTGRSRSRREVESTTLARRRLADLALRFAIAMAPPSTPAKGSGGKAHPPPAPITPGTSTLASKPSSTMALKDTMMSIFRALVVIAALYKSYTIRLYAVEVYGRVIHEFDPWFNFRATQYLVNNGWHAFFRWFDHSVWYPLGRPVGTTIYPGMQLTAAYIFYAVRALGFDVSLNDVCVFLPAGFSILACLFTAGIAYEGASKGHKWTAFAVTAGVMSVLPAHLMRSIAGGYDNECIAVTAIVATFYWWVRSLRTERSWPIAFVAALSYFYMVAAWGGYTFVLNMIGVHAGILAVSGRFTRGLYKAYSIFYLLGTALAVRVPVVGWMPLQSMEQMGPLFVLGLMQLAAHAYARKRALSERDFRAYLKRLTWYGVVGAAVLLTVMVQSGKIGGLSARVRGLFVPHTRTGNPLVDSVAEHQATQGDVYWKYFHFTVFAAPVGMVACTTNKNPARVFVAAYFIVAGYFSSKMVRLVLLLGPAAAAATGVSVGRLVDWLAHEAATMDEVTDPAGAAGAGAAGKESSAQGKGKEFSGGRADRRANKKGQNKRGGRNFRIDEAPEFVAGYFRDNAKLRKAIAGVALAFSFSVGRSFVQCSERMARSMSEPSIIVRGRGPGGDAIILDDFRESYLWLKENTPEDARVMAWWDYGYQINGIANRTTLADGNTWNHEHIALLGKCLVSPELEGHKIVRHLADYVLVWTTRFAGMYGDDLAKSPHMARIAGSVYPDVSQEGFYVDEMGRPSESMRESLLYKLHSFGMQADVPELEKYEEVYTSKYKMVRIWKVLDVDEESKRAAAAGENKKCDAGGWYCPGEYPEVLRDVLSKKRDFQLSH